VIWIADPRQRGEKVLINTKKRNRMRSYALYLGVVMLTACEPEARAEKPGQRFVVADVILTVTNRSERTAQIALESDTLTSELGDVASGASQSFSLPSALVGSSSALRFKAMYDGAHATRSDTFQVQRGQQVMWTFADTGRGTMKRR
jgi:hypothetical protein